MTQEQIIFLRSYDFLRIGQAISHQNWTSAGMCVQKLQKQAMNLELKDFERLFGNLKLAVAHREKKTALDILAQITARRVAALNRLGNEQKSAEEKQIQ